MNGHDSITFGAGPTDGLFTSMESATLLLLVKVTGGVRPDFETAIGRILRQVVTVAHDAVVTQLDPSTIAASVALKSKQSLDPVEVHALVQAFRTRIGDELERCGASSEVRVLPLMPVESVTFHRENLAALNEMLETILNGRLGVQFQPIVDLGSGRILGYESLIRVPQDGTLTKPGALFRHAENARLVSWVDMAYQETCFRGAARAGLRANLFINMDAEGLAYLHTADRSLADRAQELGISPNSIVMEITERQSVHDYHKLAEYIDQLRAEGFRIAIDDAGAGYASLHAIAQLRPDFLKIERSLIRGLHANGTRTALVESLAHFASKIGAEVIAEGIETEDELEAVIQAGVRYGQGYLLGRPSDSFRDVRRAFRDLLPRKLAKRGHALSTGLTLEQIAVRGTVFCPETPLDQIIRRFERDPDLRTIAIVTGDHLIGVVRREILRTERSPVCEATVRHGLISSPRSMEAHLTAEDAALIASYRPATEERDDIVVTRDGCYLGLVTTGALLRALAQPGVSARAA